MFLLELLLISSIRSIEIKKMHANVKIIRKDNMKKTISTEEAKKKTLKPEWMPGGSRRQELLDKAVEYLKAPIMETQAARHHFCLNNLMMTETEYLEALNKASNGELVRTALND